MLNKLIGRIKLLFRQDKELYSALYDILGFYPDNIKYYKQALMHKSIMHREKGKPINNERLEFLGDAILDAVVGDIVYQHFEGKREGFLTNTRSKIVQRDTLNKLARELGITNLIVTSGNSGSHNSYLGGNAFEALVGAIYLDKGYEACMRFIKKRILGQLINIDKVAYKEVNFKSKLIEWSQKNRVNIDFVLIEQKKDNSGSPMFQYQVTIEGVEGCTGKGYSKKESQQQASKLTLERLRKEPQYIEAIFAAKGNRTKMEEEPVEIVPDTEQKDDFIIIQNKEVAPKKTAKASKKGNASKTTPANVEKTEEEDEFDLSDISAAPTQASREEIIAAAEEAAFAEQEG